MTTIDYHEQMIAAKYSTVLGTLVEPLSAVADTELSHVGWRVKTAGGIHAEIWTMLFTYRLALVPADDYYQAAVPFWCFHRSGTGLAVAMGNAALWDGTENWAPTGYTRAWPRELEPREHEETPGRLTGPGVSLRFLARLGYQAYTPSAR